MSEISFEEFHQKYHNEGEINHGNFAKVYRIRHKQTSQLFALKKITIKNIKDKQHYIDAQNQLTILSQFKHPSIVTMYEYYKIQIKNGFGKAQTEIGIVLESAKCTLDFMIKNRISLGKQKFVIQQIIGLVSALSFLQKQNYAHRDIKPANILIFPTQQGNIWKLADFGLSLNLKDKLQNEPFVGTVEYASPKLKQKFTYKGKVPINSDPIKDDVYSLGLTLLELFEEKKKFFTPQTFSSLKQRFQSSEMVNILELMLKTEEQQRPCWKQLLMVFKRDCAEEFPKQEVKIFGKQKPEASKQIMFNQNVDYNYHHIENKTIKKKDKISPNVQMIEVKKNIQCILSIDENKIMCGCDNGEIIFIVGEDVVHCGHIHSDFVSVLTQDDDGNIWSAGGNGQVFKWNRNALRKGLSYNVVIEEKKEKNMFKRAANLKIQRKKVLKITQQISQSLQTNSQHNSPISALHALNVDNFAIGYYNGVVYAKQQSHQYLSQIHEGPVTSVKIDLSKNVLFSSGIDKFIKKVDLNLSMLDHRIYISPTYIIGIQVLKNGQTLALINGNGKVIFLDEELNFQEECSIRIQNILACSFEPNNCYMVSDEGQFSDVNEEICASLGKNGWNCLSKIGDREMVVGSFEGLVSVLRW